MTILSRDVYGKIYFNAHHPGSVDLVIDPDIRYGRGPITLSAAAAEDLSTNLQVNAELARRMSEMSTGRQYDQLSSRSAEQTTRTGQEG